MSDIRSKLNAIYSMEQLAAKNTGIHRLHPDVKIIVTLVYIVCVASLGRYDLARLAPFLFYPVLMITAAELPPAMILRRALAALPFCLFAGVSNLIFDKKILLRIAGVPVSGGFLSLLTLTARSLLCVSAVLILAGVTPFSLLSDSLRRAHVPEIMVSLLEMVYRFTAVLIGEAASMVTAFRLRANGRQWPDLREFIPFTGQLFLRSSDRAERIYQAMQCRGGHLQGVQRMRRPLNRADFLFLLAGCGSAVLFRLFDITQRIGALFI
ncbi:MAG: cobalt ECF transporter T component CbiQ [Eubacteriales bacterium]|nr:cobalt ECF transporter T component CbiQ [Eubacteriales bacterium]